MMDLLLKQMVFVLLVISNDEGVPGQKTYVMKDGILETYINDRQSAEHFNLKPTGNSRAEAYNHPQIVRMTNTYISPAKDPMNSEELLELIKNGFLLMQGGGGQRNIQLWCCRII